MNQVTEDTIECQKKIKWESPECNYCGNDDNPFYLETSDKRFHGRTLRLVKCPVCGLIYADPRPTTESYIEIYKTLWAEESRKFKYERRGVESWHRKLITDAMKFRPKARNLFDVGTGSGTILIAGRKMGLRVAGNDLNLYSCNWLKKRGYQIFNQPTKDVVLDDKFDIVMCLDYIEHTNTPYDDLNWIMEHTKKDGLLYLKTMYLDSEEYKQKKEKWHMLSGFHTHYFYKDVLQGMIEAAGFKILKKKLNLEIIHLIARK